MFLNNVVFLLYEVTLDDLVNPVQVLRFTPKTFQIILLSNLSTLSVPGGGYSTKALRALIFISTFLLHQSHSFIYLFIYLQKHQIILIIVQQMYISVFALYLAFEPQFFVKFGPGITVYTLIRKLCLEFLQSCLKSMLYFYTFLEVSYGHNDVTRAKSLFYLI